MQLPKTAIIKKRANLIRPNLKAQLTLGAWQLVYFRGLKVEFTCSKAGLNHLWAGMNYSCGQWGSRGAGARDSTEWAVKIKHRQAQFLLLRELSCCLNRKHPNQNPTFQVRFTYRWQLHMPHNTSRIRCTGDTTVVSQMIYYTLLLLTVFSNI